MKRSLGMVEAVGVGERGILDGKRFRYRFAGRFPGSGHNIPGGTPAMSARTKLYVAGFVGLILGVWWSPTKGLPQRTSMRPSRREDTKTTREVGPPDPATKWRTGLCLVACVH